MKRVLSIILSISLIFGIAPGLNLTANAEANTGTCGDSLTWSFDNETGELIISGTGEMNDYSSDLDIPWYLNRYRINTVKVDSGVTSIGNLAFYDCASLKNVAIGDSVTSIGKEAFYACESLANITIPDSVISIGDVAFGYCTSLTNIMIPDSVTSSIGKETFLSCISLASVVIGNGVTSIGDDAFFGCKSLTSVTMGDGVKSIGNSSFGYCELLKSVNIGNNVASIGGRAFSYCESLTSVSISDSVTIIENSAFEHCTSLTGLIVPDSVTSIGNYAFYDCIALESISIGDGVTRIGTYAFYNCTSLTSITIPNGVTIIGEHTFNGCSSLTSVMLTNSLTSIDYWAFYNCTSLTSIAIPSSVKSIGYMSFCNCESLMDVYYGGSEVDWNNISFNSHNECLINATIHYNSTMPESYVTPSITGDLYKDNSKIYGIDVQLNPNWFFSNSKSYNHNIAKLCSQLDLEGYEKKSDVKLTLTSLGFNIDDNYINLNTDRDEVNYYIASKKIAKNGENYNLVFVGCIGSHGYQWNSNFDPWGVDSSTSYNDNTSLSSEGGINHRGFNDAKNFVYNRLYMYLDKYGYEKNNTKILLTGHSRGAATANLLGARLIDEDDCVSPENLFTYTFATPNNTSSKNISAEKYRRIFNIVNPQDFVTKVMLKKWGFGRYGTTYTLPCTTNDDKYKKSLKGKMLKYYDILNYAFEGDNKYEDYNTEATVYNVVKTMGECVSSVKEFYNSEYVLSFPFAKCTPFEYFQWALCPQVNKTKDEQAKKDSLLLLIDSAIQGGKLYGKVSRFFLTEAGGDTAFIFDNTFTDSHKMTTYCAFMMGLSANEVTTNRKAYKGTVNCPVDVEVYDSETNELVGRIKNNAVDEKIAAKDDAVYMSVDGDEKEYWLPANGDYKVVLTGNDNGIMDYSVTEIDSELEETEKVNFYNIPLSNDVQYTSDFSEDTVVSDVILVSDEYEKITPDEVFTDDVIEYKVDIIVSGDGSVTESTIVSAGDYITLNATPVNSKFLGWYVNDTLLSANIEYRFRPTSNISITAKFTVQSTQPSTQPTTKPADTVALDNATTATTTTTQPATTTATAVKKPKATSIKKATAGKKQVKITWKAISGVTGYQIQYSTDKKFKKGNKTVTVKGAKKTSTNVKKLKSKKKYYVRIRTYKGKNYSSWSKAKTVKIK